MAATGVVYERCPECDVVVPITMTFQSRTFADTLIIEAEPDLTDAVTHAWTHDDQGGW